MTEHPTRDGKVDCAAVLNASRRTFIGYANDSTQDSTLVVNSLDIAIRPHQPGPGGILHSDHGFQGEFNWSPQHFSIAEVLKDGDDGLEQNDQRCPGGRASTVACRSGVAPADAVARAA